MSASPYRPLQSRQSPSPPKADASAPIICRAPDRPQRTAPATGLDATRNPICQQVRSGKSAKKSARHDERPPPWSIKPPSPLPNPGKNYLGLAWSGSAGARVDEAAIYTVAATGWDVGDGMVRSSPGRRHKLWASDEDCTLGTAA